MARPANRQSRSVGNLGDILKHAALTELAVRLGERIPVHYVDTHAYLLHAPIADLARWSREIDALVGERPAYARYAALERESLSRTGQYRCSSGLVLDVLGDRRASATLGEANAVTRAALNEQIRAERLADVRVTNDAVAALRAIAGGTTLIHVDPFALSPELWASLAPALDASCERSTSAVLVVYRYTRSARSPWPWPPTSMVGPVAETRGGPHELAAYASPSNREMVREVCAALGWQLEPS